MTDIEVVFSSGTTNLLSLCVCVCMHDKMERERERERETEGSRLHLQCTILFPGSTLCTQLGDAIIAHKSGSLGTKLLHTEGRGLTCSFMSGTWGKVGGNTGGAGTAVQDAWKERVANILQCMHTKVDNR